MQGETITIFAVLALGFVAGILSGMFGIGGGLVIVPVLVVFFEMPLKTATGTSLFALMWPVGLLGVVAYWRGGHLNPWMGIWIAVGLFFGAYLGARLTLSLSPVSIRRYYALFLLIVGTYFLVSSFRAPGARLSSPVPGERGHSVESGPAAS
ncbi:MAG: hypothetical protein NVSMB9_05890 [Isosphaeraceae bacterium]